MKWVRWWWRRWRAQHFAWLAYMDWQVTQDHEDKARWKRAQAHYDQIWMDSPRRKTARRRGSPGSAPTPPPSPLR